MDESGCGLPEVLSWDLPGETGESYRKLIQDSIYALCVSNRAPPVTEIKLL
jgi:hypothetical protein